MSTIEQDYTEARDDAQADYSMTKRSAVRAGFDAGASCAASIIEDALEQHRHRVGLGLVSDGVALTEFAVEQIKTLASRA